MKHILLVGDNLALRQPPSGIPEREESAVQTATTGAEPTSLDHQQSTELVTLELTMPEQACLETLLQLRGSELALQIAVASGGSRVASPRNILKLEQHPGTDATMANPFESQETLDTIALLGPTTKQSA